MKGNSKTTKSTTTATNVRKGRLQSDRVIVVDSVFMVRKINLPELVEDYKNGVYEGYPSFLKNTKKQKHKKNEKLLDDVSSTAQSDICNRTSITGETTKSVTTGIPAFKGEMGGTCFYCRTDYDWEGFGYCIHSPIKRREKCIKEKSKRDGDTEVQNDEYTTKIYYIVLDRRLCSDICLIKYLNYINLPSDTREQYMKYTLLMLRDAYGIMDTLKRVSEGDYDFRLLKHNGGTESYDKWISGERMYELINHRVIVPTKLEFKITDLRIPSS